jgi:hypothetical protein
MRTVRRLLLLAGPLALWSCESPTAVPPVTGPQLDLHPAGGHAVTGSGHVPSGGGQRLFTFHARDRGDGTVKGSYRIKFTATGLFVSVDVTCVAVVGNTGWVGGRIADSNIPGVRIGTVSYFYAIDNGEGAGASPDRVSSARLNDVDGEDIRFCTERPLLLPSFDIQEGNVQVW